MIQLENEINTLKSKLLDKDNQMEDDRLDSKRLINEERKKVTQLKDEIFKLKQQVEKKRNKYEQQMLEKDDKMLEMSREMRKAQQEVMRMSTDRSLNVRSSTPNSVMRMSHQSIKAFAAPPLPPNRMSIER